jgi:predicted RNA-binding Zn-ribbon protein involved in translation (DUF1610 family)
MEETIPAQSKKMIRCTTCNAEFKTYKSYEEIGKCPNCGNWITFVCKKCSQPVLAEAYLKNKCHCPSCNKWIPLPGAGALEAKQIGKMFGKLFGRGIGWIITFFLALLIIALIKRC